LSKFGNKGIFSIEYEFLSNPFNEDNFIGETWGIFKLTVMGNDVFQFEKENSVKAYQWNLIYIVEWFSENLKYILSKEPFPLPVEGAILLSL